MRKATLDAIERAFDKSAAAWSRTRTAGWTVELTNGHRLTVDARVDTARTWLSMDCRTPRRAAGGPAWTALELNATLPAFIRLVAGDDCVRVASEIPLERREPLAARIGGACEGFLQAVAALERDGGVSESGARGEDEAWDSAGEVIGACEEMGWSVTARADGRWAVPLPGRGGGYPALLEHGSGGLTVSSELLSAEQLPAPSRQAIGALLLAATGQLSLVRAVAVSGERTSVRLAVNVGPNADAAEVSQALDALALGCELTAAEARALRNELVAERYLAFRGMNEGAG